MRRDGEHGEIHQKPEPERDRRSGRPWQAARLDRGTGDVSGRQDSELGDEEPANAEGRRFAMALLLPAAAAIGRRRRRSGP